MKVVTAPVPRPELIKVKLWVMDADATLIPVALVSQANEHLALAQTRICIN